MKKSVWIGLFFLLLLSVAFVSAQETPVTGDSPDAAIHQWDKSATAQSLGLVPFEIPEDFYPVFPWDHISCWGKTEPTAQTQEIVSPWGTPVQPIDVAIESMADCRFTMSAFVSANEAQFCAKNGLRYIVEANYPRDLLATLTEEEAQEHIKTIVASTKDDPNCIGYYLTDEPGANAFPGLAKLTAAVKKYAPGKLAYINLFPCYASTIGADRESQLQTCSYEEYLERFVQEVKPQLLSYDDYIVEYSEDMTDRELAATYWRDLLTVRRIAQKYDLPWWNTICSLSIRGTSSPPTMARMAFETYTSLAAGADGLCWYLYYTLGYTYAPIDPSGRKTLTWTYLRAINEQAQVLGKVLKGYRSTDVWFSQPLPEGDLSPNPQNLVKDVSLAWSTNGRDIQETPSVMVGQFQAKDGSHSAVMVVNLNFGRSVKVEVIPTEEGKNITAVSAIDGQTEERPANGWWILPGHGKLFLIR